MKKLLLASVAALSLAAFAASANAAVDSKDGLKLGLGGYFSAQGATISQDDSTTAPGYQKRNTSIFSYGEVNFLAEKTFDNGLTVGYKGVLQLPQATNSVTVRQDFAYFSGNWGRIEAGQNYSPAYYMSLGAPAVNDEFDAVDPDMSLVNITSSTVTNSTTGATVNAATNYATIGFTPFYRTGGLLGDKIVYYTPRFNGFQAGVSYQPDANRSGDGVKSVTGGFVGDTSAAGTGYANQSERVEAGVGYEGSFSGVGVKLSGVYGHGNHDGNTAARPEVKDESAWGGGAQLTWANWTLGAGYLWDNNGQKFKGSSLTADGESKIWNAGLGYGVGPYHAGVTYYQNSTDVIRSTNTASTDKLKRWVVGGGYTVAPGVDLNTTLQFHKYENSTTTDNAGKNDATLFTVGSTVNF